MKEFVSKYVYVIFVCRCNVFASIEVMDMSNFGSSYFRLWTVIETRNDKNERALNLLKINRKCVTN